MSLGSVVFQQAKQAIQLYGSPVSLVSRTTTYSETLGQTTVQEATKTTYAVVETRIGKINAYTTLGLSSATGVIYDIKLVFSATDTPQLHDVVVVGGVRYTIERIDPIVMGDTTVTYEVYGKRE